MNFLYVDGSSYSDQLKISRWFSTGFPLRPPALAVAPAFGVPCPVEVLPQAESSISPPRPRAERRVIGCPAARSTWRWSASIFDLVSTGARTFSWSGFSFMGTSVVGLGRRFGQQDGSCPLPLDGDRVPGTDGVVRVVGAGALLTDEHPGAAVERGEDLDLVAEIHLGGDDGTGC